MCTENPIYCCYGYVLCVLVSSCVMVLQDDDGETSRSSSVYKRLSLPMVDSLSVIVINASSKVTGM